MKNLAYCCFPSCTLSSWNNLLSYSSNQHDHDDWNKRKEDYSKRIEDRKGSKNKPSSSSVASSKGQTSSKMAVSKNIRVALISKLGISDKDMESMATDILGKE